MRSINGGSLSIENQRTDPGPNRPSGADGAPGAQALFLMSKRQGATTRSSWCARIAAARRADQRQGCANANLSGQIVKTVDATSQALAILERSADRLNLSPRAVTRLLKVARSIADLAGAERIEPGHLAEAFELRAADWVRLYDHAGTQQRPPNAGRWGEGAGKTQWCMTQSVRAMRSLAAGGLVRR